MKRVQAWVILGLFLGLLPGAGALASDKQGMFMAYGPGNEPCSDFDAIRDRRFGNLTADQHKLVEDAVEYWLSGFYTSWNYFSSDTFDISGGIKYDAVLQQMENFCERNPKKKIVDAAIVVGHAMHATRSKAAPKKK